MRDRVLQLLRRHGRSTTSFVALEPGMSYWFDGDDAVVAYAEARGAWIAATAPICPPEREADVCAGFVEAARARGNRACFFAVDDSFGERGFDLLHLGLEAMFEPAAWPDALSKKRSLREQLRRARAKGVTIDVIEGRALAAEPEPLRSQIAALADNWRATRKMAPMSFLVELDPFGSMTERRYFVARRGHDMVAVLIAVPVYDGGGWYLEDLLREPDAPNGTTELLFDAAMRASADDGAAEVSYGLAPLADSPSPWLRRARTAGRFLYHFDGVFSFKDKLSPKWSPRYLAYPHGTSRGRHLVDVLRAFAGGSFVKFGAATLVHRAPAVVMLLALLLVPWTVGLALAPTAWFPSDAVKWAWVGYDALLFTGLIALATRFRRRLAIALAAAAALDFVMGAVQLAVHNASLAPSTTHVTAIALGLAAPLFAAIYLFAARRWPRLPPLKNRE